MRTAGPGCVTHLRCLVCSSEYEYGNLHTCPSCGLSGILDVQYDDDAVASSLNAAVLAKRPLDHWRYRELLPVIPDAAVPPLQIGWTPVYEVPRLAAALGIANLFLKDDGRNPTASFKDRASSIGVMKAQEFGFSTIACASTGNAASSLAGCSAAVGLQSVIFVPQRAPEPKVTQLLIFGATVVRVQGTYEQAFELCREACRTYGWYDRNSGTNPFLVEGKKTAGLEIAEQFGADVPDWVAVSVGDGCTIGGIGKGLQEMRRLGFLPRTPRLLGVQAEGARPIVDAFLNGHDLRPVRVETLADSIAVGTPRNWRRAVQHVRGSGGTMIAVPDADILDAMRLTAQLGGIFAEPAAAAAVAGLKRAVGAGIVKRGESALAVITGNGLKDVHSARQAAGHPIDIPPEPLALEKHLRDRSII